MDLRVAVAVPLPFVEGPGPAVPALAASRVLAVPAPAASPVLNRLRPDAGLGTRWARVLEAALSRRTWGVHRRPPLLRAGGQACERRCTGGRATDHGGHRLLQVTAQVIQLGVLNYQPDHPDKEHLAFARVCSVISSHMYLLPSSKKLAAEFEAEEEEGINVELFWRGER